jgi:hypothetical protein
MKPRQIPLIGPAFTTQTPESFRNFVKALYEMPEKATPVPHIKIVFGKKVTQVRFSKGVKRVVTKAQLKTLAEFYETSVKDLTELLTKRKVTIK